MHAGSHLAYFMHGLQYSQWGHKWNGHQEVYRCSRQLADGYDSSASKKTPTSAEGTMQTANHTWRKRKKEKEGNCNEQDENKLVRSWFLTASDLGDSVTCM